MTRIAVIGAGAWGTALAESARRAGRDTLIWAREPDVVAAINDSHENTPFLPGVTLDKALRATGDLNEAAGRDVILMVTPAQHMRAILAQMAPALKKGAPLVLCAKGIELATGKLLTEVAAETVPGHPVAILSGPTFAAETARGLPTAITLATADRALGTHLVDLLGSAAFRPYLALDPVGAQLGGAIKNVLAIGCGIAQGKGLGDNARAALITRGLAEMARLGVALGGQRETLMGMSGLGDLTLTCNSMQSRNFSLGVELGQGRALADILAERRTVAEGVPTARAVTGLARRMQVEMPICAAVDAVLNDGASVADMLRGLLDRPFREEAA